MAPSAALVNKPENRRSRLARSADTPRGKKRLQPKSVTACSRARRGHESLDAKINSDAPAGQQLDELEGWLDRQKDHDAGDWPAAGEFTGGKHDRHDSADDLKA